MRSKYVATGGNLAYKVAERADVKTSKTAEKSTMKKSTIKPYFADIVAGEPSQVVKDTQLLDAAIFGDTERVRELLDLGANPNASGGRPIYWAVANGHAQTVQALLERGAKAPDRDALLQAAKSGYDEVVALLRKHYDTDALKEALRLAAEGNVQTPGAFGARLNSPENGHAKTVAILKGLAPLAAS